VVTVYAALYELTPLRLDPGHPLTWVVLFFADDLAYYWFHRVSHESRVFWASHVVHHSSQHYNLSTALRQTWVPMTYSRSGSRCPCSASRSGWCCSPRRGR
jgi:sterol desaturase/sphingolipid hydroxylase (fatty acid hydroxylase superfamily)